MLVNWFGANGRCYPWRQTTDPYRVLIAAFMLQRTGVGQVVMNVYPHFVDRFPDFDSLAAAEEWSWRTSFARSVVPADCGNSGAVTSVRDVHKSVIPRDLASLECLPGIDSTGRSVLCMAYRLPVIARPKLVRPSRRAHQHRKQTAHRPNLIERLDREVPPDHPREFNLALLDVGSTFAGIEHPDTSCVR